MPLNGEAPELTAAVLIETGHDHQDIPPSRQTLRIDGFDFDLRVVLSVSLLLVIALFGLVLVDDDLLTRPSSTAVADTVAPST